MNDLSECLAKVITSFSHSIKEMIPVLCKLAGLIEVAMIKTGRGFDTERESLQVLCFHYNTIIGFIESYPELLEWFPKWKGPFDEFRIKLESLKHEHFLTFLKHFSVGSGENC